MGHRVSYEESLFDGVHYNKKTTEQLRESMSRKVAALNAHIITREGRMAKLREEYEIGAELLAQLIMQFQRDQHATFTNYNHQSGKQLIPAGVIANIIREQEMIDSERKQIRKMELVLRNLTETELYFTEDTGEVRERRCIHFLSDEELEYLGY